MNKFLTYKEELDREFPIEETFNKFMAFCFRNNVQTLQERLCIAVKIFKFFWDKNSKNDINCPSSPKFMVEYTLIKLTKKTPVSFFHQKLIEDMIELSSQDFQKKYTKKKATNEMYNSIAVLCKMMDDIIS